MSSTDEKTHGETVDSSVAEKTAKVEVKEEPEDRIEAAVEKMDLFARRHEYLWVLLQIPI